VDAVVHGRILPTFINRVRPRTRKRNAKVYAFFTPTCWGLPGGRTSEFESHSRIGGVSGAGSG
jgi:8-oxo-dGTP pyrophosphatase MutT (NUDIX family)